MTKQQSSEKHPSTPADSSAITKPDEARSDAKPKEIGGPKGLEPTRYGDWEKAGRCIDF